MTNLEPHSSGANSPELAGTLAETWPVRARNFLARHLEPVFVALLATMVVAVFYYFPYKIAFLNFFYLPVLVAAYFLGRRKAVLGATFAVLLMVFFAYLHPDWFTVVGTRLNTLLLIATWGGFLILTSAGVGSLQERLAKGFEETHQLLEELKGSRVIQEMKEKVEKTLYSTLDPVVARLATEGKLRYEKREVSIMFTDLSNFTAYSDQNRPDVVLEDLNRFLGQMEPIIEQYRGHIDKYMGDGVMVEFGAPVDYERHALLAVVSALKMQEKVKSLQFPWRLRIGIATGSVIVGMMGVRRQAYSAVGDRVNIAKRLEEICLPEKIYIDEPTYLAVEPFVHATKLRNAGYSRQQDIEQLERLRGLEEQLSREGESAELLHVIGKTHFALRDASSAIRSYERALVLDPDSTAIKLAYADASIKKDEFEKVQLKGKLRKITVYDVLGIKDRWEDPDVIPPDLREKYRNAEGQNEVPHDLILAVQALDGSIGYGRVVGLLSFAIADQMKVSEVLKKLVLQAGYMQDIGKEAVPHHILNRPGSLTEQESKLLENYVPESVATLKRLGYVDPRLLEIVNHHHEAWNGTGYPAGLRGEAIPLGARITAVAEAYSALTAWRPYREAWDLRMAVSAIRKELEKGRLDPKVVQALFELLQVSP